MAPQERQGTQRRIKQAGQPAEPPGQQRQQRNGSHVHFVAGKEACNSFSRNAANVPVQRIVDPEIVPNKGAAGDKDAIQLARNIGGHPLVQDGCKDREYRGQMKCPVRKWQFFRIGQFEIDAGMMTAGRLDAFGHQINAEKIFGACSPLLHRGKTFPCATAHVEDAAVAQREVTELPEQLLKFAVAFPLQCLVPGIRNRPLRFPQAANRVFAINALNPIDLSARLHVEERAPALRPQFVPFQCSGFDLPRLVRAFPRQLNKFGFGCVVQNYEVEDPAQKSVSITKVKTGYDERQNRE